MIKWWVNSFLDTDQRFWGQERLGHFQKQITPKCGSGQSSIKTGPECRQVPRDWSEPVMTAPADSLHLCLSVSSAACASEALPPIWPLKPSKQLRGKAEMERDRETEKQRQRRQRKKKEKANCQAGTHPPQAFGSCCLWCCYLLWELLEGKILWPELKIQ